MIYIHYLLGTKEIQANELHSLKIEKATKLIFYTI